MEIPKEQVLEFVPGGAAEIARANEELPEMIDTDRDAALLEGHGIPPMTLLGQFNGSAS